MEKYCTICNKTLSGRQTLFCSSKCKSSHTNNKHQNYISQQRRGSDRRAELIRLKGGRCEVCGYEKNQAALSFHHINPAEKSFPIDLRKCSNSSWNNLVKEADKCQLLC